MCTLVIGHTFSYIRAADVFTCIHQHHPSAQIIKVLRQVATNIELTCYVVNHVMYCRGYAAVLHFEVEFA